MVSQRNNEEVKCSIIIVSRALRALQKYEEYSKEKKQIEQEVQYQIYYGATVVSKL